MGGEARARGEMREMRRRRCMLWFGGLGGWWEVMDGFRCAEVWRMRRIDIGATSDCRERARSNRGLRLFIR